MMLTTSPESENTHTVIRLAEAALRQGVEVHIYLMADGVYNIHIRELMALAEKGVQLALCERNAALRQAGRKEGILYGSQYDLAQMVQDVDRFLAFN